MDAWGKPKTPIAARLADAAQKLRDIIPLVLDQQKRSILAMAELAKTTQRKP